MNIAADVLIMLALAVYLLFAGLIFVGGLDGALKGYRFKTDDETMQEDECEILIGGDTELAESFAHMLTENGISCRRMSSQDADFHKHAAVWQKKDGRQDVIVFALDQSDYHNLLLCGITSRLVSGSRLYGICNEAANRSIFLENKIRILEKRGVTVDGLYRLLRQNYQIRSI